jgi:hypothetical protein
VGPPPRRRRTSSPGHINECRATLFYQHLGFVRTGHTKPYPNDPALVEYEMARSLL